MPPRTRGNKRGRGRGGGKDLLQRKKKQKTVIDVSAEEEITRIDLTGYKIDDTTFNLAVEGNSPEPWLELTYTNEIRTDDPDEYILATWITVKEPIVKIIVKLQKSDAEFFQSKSRPNVPRATITGPDGSGSMATWIVELEHLTIFNRNKEQKETKELNEPKELQAYFALIDDNKWKRTDEERQQLKDRARARYQDHLQKNQALYDRLNRVPGPVVHEHPPSPHEPEPEPEPEPAEAVEEEKKKPIEEVKQLDAAQLLRKLKECQNELTGLRKVVCDLKPCVKQMIDALLSAGCPILSDEL